MQKGKQSLCFTEAPFIISTANIVGKKEGEGPLAGHFDVIGEDDKFGQNTWEEAESTLQKEAFTMAVGLDSDRKRGFRPRKREGNGKNHRDHNRKNCGFWNKRFHEHGGSHGTSSQRGHQTAF